MCIIIDVNVAEALLLNANPVESWLYGKRDEPRLVVGGLLHKELAKNNEVLKRLRVLDQAGRLRTVDPAILTKAQHKARTSNDAHVLALALASGARTLCTNDGKLATDFKNPAIVDNPRGSVYKTPSHRHLLQHTASSCGVNPKPTRKKR